MGFWGYLVVGRDDRPLPELYALRPFRSDVAGNRVRADNWQICSLRSEASIPDTVALLVELCAETHAPVLMVSVLNDDCVSVEGFSQDGYWQACPARHSAAAGERSGDAACATEAAVRAVGWAAAADRRIEADPIADLLFAPPDRRVDGFFEELLERLGLERSTCR